MKVEYTLQRRIRGVSEEITRIIETYSYLDTLIAELSQDGYYQRLETVPQLGMVHVNSEFLKKRKTYVMMQLYLHDYCRRALKSDKKNLYGTELKMEDLGDDITLDGKYPSIADAEQALVLTCNIGHFMNTFASSRAMISYLNRSQSSIESFAELLESPEVGAVARRIINTDDYHQFHLLNGFLILLSCNKSIPGVRLAIAVLRAYLLREECVPSGKMQEIFELYKVIRDLTMITYDLQVARIPFFMALWNENDLKHFLIERVSTFQDNSAATDFMNASLKLLSKTLYFQETQVIKEYQSSKSMTKHIPKELPLTRDSYLKTFLLDEGYGLNSTFKQSRTYGAKHRPWLKISLTTNAELVKKLDRIEYVDAGYYRRRSGQTTFVAQIKESCSKRAMTALKIIRTIVPYLCEYSYLENEVERDRTLLQVFLFFASEFFCNEVRVDPTVTRSDRCVLGVRGSRKRWEQLDNILIDSYTDDPDKKHEVSFMRDYLKNDHKNDFAIMIPSSIKVTDSETRAEICEFDGMIIFPNRNDGQIVFLEAKNMRKGGKAANCLKKKFRKINMTFEEANLCTYKNSQDVAYVMTLM